MLLGASSPAEDILKKADAFRSPEGSFELRCEVVENSTKQKSVFDVFIQNNDHSLMVTRAPQRDVGRNLLMMEREMWVFIPNLNRPVRIALQQRLVGQVANGDLSRLKWVGDYKPSIEKKDSKTIQMLLKAQQKRLTYEQIRIYIDAKSYRPQKADYLTPNGKILKSSTFEDYGPLAGADRPRKMIITDALKKSESSTIKILSMNTRKFPTGFFTEANLARPKL